MQALDELMRRCREDYQTPTYRDLLDLRQALQPAAAAWNGLTDADINHLMRNTHPENRYTLVERAEQLLRELNGQPQKEQKLRPDFLAGYDAGLADAKRQEDRSEDAANLALLGWQKVSCPVCGCESARGYPKPTEAAQPVSPAYKIGGVA